ncbi:hypothetical protein [Serratia quinivorans]|uniref:hypothetical protein n=1 Tax=Serratia quinivorans TaxID=137545 RepID=UPI003F99CE69
MAQRHNTGNPRPSNSMKDLNDNALAYDDFLNGEQEVAYDRFQQPFPTVRKQVSERINEIIGAQQDAEIYAAKASQAADNAQNIADANTYYITPEDPDGTIAGLAGTPDGESFRVAIPDATGGTVAFNYYKNNGGVAEYINSQPNKRYIDEIYEVAESTDKRTESLQESPDSLFDVVSANGIRKLRIRNTDGGIELNGVIDRLLTGDSGLNFSGSTIDNNAPPGWLFIIHSINGVVIAGVKEDGTKVGWGGDGGGQAGGITPGDTAVGYDDIRNYTGDATVRDVVGERINGRFVVDASDSTSPDDGGGVLVGVDGRRWVRQADYVSYDMFGAPRIPEATYQQYEKLSRTGSENSAQALLAPQAAADQAMVRCHAFANKYSLPVVQNTGRFLWIADEIIVRTPCDLTGCTVVTSNRSGTDEAHWGNVDGVYDNSVQPMYMYRIQGKARIDFTADELAELNTTYSTYLRKGSAFLPMPKLSEYRGGMVAFISSTVELYRSGERSSPRYEVHLRDFSRIGRNGSLSDQLVKNIPNGTVVEVWVQPKEDAWLTFNPPTFFEAGNGRKFVNIQIERSMVNLNDLVMHNWSTGVVESRVAVGSYGVFDIRCRNATAECIPSAAGGAYVISFRNSIDIHVEGYYGLYGWGFQGHHGLKRVIIDSSVMNRFDFHSFGYDVNISRTAFKGKQVYLQGGGKYTFEDNSYMVTQHKATQAEALEYRLDYFINMREDYAGDCDCTLTVRDLVVRFDRNITAAWAAGILSFDVVRMNSGTVANYGVNTKTPHTIIGENIVFDLEGMSASLPDNFAFTFCRAYRNIYSTFNRTFLPSLVSIKDMTAINVPTDKNAAMAIFRCGSDMAQNPFGSRNKMRPNGTSVDIFGQNVVSVINNPEIENNYCPMVYLPGNTSGWDTPVSGATYRTSAYSWVPKVTLINCSPMLIHAPGVKAEFDIHGGVLARFTVGTTENNCRVTGADIQLYPDAAGNLYFDADRVRTANCDWFDPANGATYSGTLTGIGNGNRGTIAHSPNIPT